MDIHKMHNNKKSRLRHILFYIKGYYHFNFMYSRKYRIKKVFIFTKKYIVLQKKYLKSARV